MNTNYGNFHFLHIDPWNQLFEEWPFVFVYFLDKGEGVSGCLIPTTAVRPSTIGYPILFIPKGNGKLKLYIDYKQLNSIIIKNRYALPLIPDLRDKVYRA